LVQTAAKMIIGAFRVDCGAHVFGQILNKSQPLFLSGQALQSDEVKNYHPDSSVHVDSEVLPNSQQSAVG
jgi:hypothetical protein